MKTKKNKKSKKTRKHLSLDLPLSLGGQVLASGGYGCVFQPALRCQGKKSREKNKISKVMTNRHAEEEYQEILEVKKKVDTIPNYQNYFLVNDFHLCVPEKFTSKDLRHFDKCKSLERDNITKENINDSLGKIKLLTMPYGGIPVDDFVSQKMTNEKGIQFNNCLLELLEKGIVPMNQKGIYHGDIKDSNILVDDSGKEMKTRIIDWGLAEEYSEKKKKIPESWRNRPLQFNVPFSIVLFTDMFDAEYTHFLQKEESQDMKEFVMGYLRKWRRKRGEGHFAYINHIFTMMFYYDLPSDERNETQIEREYTLPYIHSYLVEILTHYTTNIREYIENVFIHLIDIWGFVITYVPLFELLFQHYKELTLNQKKMYSTLKQIFLQYLYKPRIHVISIDELKKDLLLLNDFMRDNEFSLV